jgi:hypothetical protein
MRRTTWQLLGGAGLCGLLSLLLPLAGWAAGDNVTGFDDLKLGARYTPAQGDAPQDPINIGGITFDRASRGIAVGFGGQVFDAELSIRTLQGRIEGLVITPAVGPSVPIKNIQDFAEAYRASVIKKYSGCTTLLDTFNDRAGVLAIKDKDGDGLSLIWDVSNLTIVYQTEMMGEANLRENGKTPDQDDAAGQDEPLEPTEAPSRVR